MTILKLSILESQGLLLVVKTRRFYPMKPRRLPNVSRPSTSSREIHGRIDKFNHIELTDGFCVDIDALLVEVNNADTEIEELQRRLVEENFTVPQALERRSNVKKR